MDENLVWFGNRQLVIASILIASFIFTAFFARPKRLDWRSFGLTEAFIISLFTEMFGIPLTIYIVSALLKVDIVPNVLTGHLWATILDLAGVLDLELGVIIVMVISMILIIFGLILLIGGWLTIYRNKDTIASKGLLFFCSSPSVSRDNNYYDWIYNSVANHSYTIDVSSIIDYVL